jgi:hypothetical protein
MANWCSNILTFDGPAADVEKGLWLARNEFAESRSPDVRREFIGVDGIASPCFEFETRDWPPTEFLKKLSTMLPGTFVLCRFSEPFGGVGGFFSYRDGSLWECEIERFMLEEMGTESPEQAIAGAA